MAIHTITNKMIAIVLIQMLLLINSHSIVQAKDSGKASVSTTISFAGRWVDQKNASIQMSVREDAGLLKITAGDEAYGYQSSCLIKYMSADCIGNGGLLEGKNFLYQSYFDINFDGTITEKWKAYNNLKLVRGKTVWKRP